MTLQQYQLRHGKETLVCWLEADRVKVGDKVTLKNSDTPTEWWMVEKAFTKMDQDDIHSHGSKKLFGSIIDH